MAHKTLKKAVQEKKADFYTQLSDIEKELIHYKDQFKGKVVYCNADDPRISNFFHYFAYNFEKLGLKKLITSCYKNQNRDLFSKRDTEKAISLEYNGEYKKNLPDIEKIGIKKLKGDGDFRSKESIELLKEADIVVTNPPFPLFREYVSQLDQYNKKFLIIGNTNAITYKETFALIKENKMRTGYTNFNLGMFFIVPDDWEKYHHIDKNGKKVVRVSTSCWFTNLEVQKHKEDLILFKKYKGNEDEYPKYDNYDAIEVSKVANIPIDYKGLMGVPIGFVDKYNPDQFEIIGFTHRNDPYHLKTKIYSKEDSDNFNNLNGSPIIKNGNQYTFKFMRIIIKSKVSH